MLIHRLSMIPFLAGLLSFVTADNHAAVVPDAQPIISSENGELRVTLTIGEAMYENEFGLKQKVVGYNGHMGGPTLRAKPGDTLYIRLENQLPPEACDTNVPEMWNLFHAISATNLHTHGLFVPDQTNPTFIKVHPGESFDYTITIPEGHQGGTHWYHPHVAGSTTLQAGGGAVGLLIIQDQEGDLPEQVAKLPEITMRIQFLDFTYLQTGYATGRRGYVASCDQFCVPEENRGNCSVYFFQDGPDEGEYNTTIAPDGFEYETVAVNGIERPTIDITAGEWYRLRTLYVPTTGRTLEPSMNDACDFKLLAKDGMYIPIAPRDVHSGYMSSGNRADFLIRCMEPGMYEFLSLNEGLDSSDWNANQKVASLERVLAVFKVTAPMEDSTKEVADIAEFKVARPCYLPEMRDLKVDDVYYFIQSGLTPPLPEGESYPEYRPSWESRNISFSAMNAAGPLSPPLEEYGGPSPHDFELNLGSIVEIDFFAPQLHPLHLHVFPFQITSLPGFEDFTDYFQVGDYHDVLMVPIGGDYGKAVLRSHINTYVTDIYVHCHVYTHSDGGMAMLGRTNGTEGAASDQVSNCYSGSQNRDFAWLTQAPTPATSADSPTAAPPDSTDKSPTASPTDSPSSNACWVVPMALTIWFAMFVVAFF